VQINKYRISPHAARRMAQRNVTVGDVALVLRFGQIVYRTSAEFYFLGRRDIPRGMEQAMDALVGTTVVVEGDAISTVYRSRRALTRIKRKHKWHRARNYRPRAGA